MPVNFKNRVIAKIEGYAAIYNVADMSGDIMQENVFSEINFEKSIPTHVGSLMMLYQHKVDCPIGKWINFKNDKKGLFVQGEIILDSSKAFDIYALMRGGAINGLSVGFKTVQAIKKRASQRLIKKADLWEISIVSFPMAHDARITHVGDPVEVSVENPVRAGLSTQSARRAPFPPSGARHFAKALKGAADLLS